MSSVIVNIVGGPEEFVLIAGCFDRSPVPVIDFSVDLAPPESVAVSRGNRFRCSIRLVARNTEKPDHLYLVGATNDWETLARPKLDRSPTITTTLRMEYNTRTRKGRALMGISGGRTGEPDDYYEIFRRLHVH